MPPRAHAALRVTLVAIASLCGAAGAAGAGAAAWAWAAPPRAGADGACAARFAPAAAATARGGRRAWDALDLAYGHLLRSASGAARKRAL